MGIKNIHPHVGIDYTAKRRVRSVVTENNAATMFAPFVSNRGPENVAYKVYNNSEFVSTYGQLEFSEQGQVVLNIGNWLNAGGAVLAYRMTSVPSSFNLTSNTDIVYLVKNGKYYHIINGLLTENEGTVASGSQRPSAPTVGIAQTVGNVTFTKNSTSVDVSVDYKKLMPNDIRLAMAYGYHFNTITTTDAEGKTSTSNDVTVKAFARAKYSGTFYKGIQIRATQISKGSFKIEVIKDGNLIESYSARTKENYKIAIGSSDYIGELTIADEWFDDETNGINNAWTRTAPKTLYITLGYKDNDINTSVSVNNTSIGNAIKNGLKDKLSVKCDYILDAGYDTTIKTEIINLLVKEDETTRVRDDIIFIADSYKLYPAENVIPEDVTLTGIEDSSYETRLLAVYTQYLTTEDIYSRTSGREVYVTPTYFLAGLIPYNERIYGVHYPHAGKRRGVINDSLSLSENPTPDVKDQYYEKRKNYIERDSTSIQFMSQSTYQQEDTALRFLNNSRSLNVIMREVERIGRSYLHEMNTVTSLNNLNAAITTYLNDWVQNRALSKCEVVVYADEYDDTLVHIILNIRFSGTIEIISVEINID